MEKTGADRKEEGARATGGSPACPGAHLGLRHSPHTCPEPRGCRGKSFSTHPRSPPPALASKPASLTRARSLLVLRRERPPGHKVHWDWEDAGRSSFSLTFPGVTWESLPGLPWKETRGPARGGPACRSGSRMGSGPFDSGWETERPHAHAHTRTHAHACLRLGLAGAEQLFH